MSLLDLTLAHVAPSFIQNYLGQKFARTAIMQPILAHPYQFAVVCFDRHDRPRLVVLFNWLSGAWQYAIALPKQVKTKPLDDDGE